MDRLGRSQPSTWLTILGTHLGAVAAITRLKRPTDLALLALPGLWGLWLAAGAAPAPTMIGLFLAATFAIRCGAWVFNDLAEQRLLPAAPESLVAKRRVPPLEALWLFTALCFVAFVCAVALGRQAVIYAPLVWAWVVGFPFIKRFTLLSQIYLGLGFAFTIPMAFFALGELPNRPAWLYFTAEALLATAALTLYALPRQTYEARLGIGSLPQLFGSGTPVVVGLLQLGGIVALWFAGERAGLGDFHRLGTLVAAALAGYQQWLLRQPEGAIRAYRNNVWLSLAVFAGIAFDFHCRCG